MTAAQCNVLPRRLTPGDSIAVIAPSSGVRDDRLARGIEAIRERGYRVIEGDHLYDRVGFVAGSDAARARDLNRLFERDDVHAIFCARGGYGACRMVGMVDWCTVVSHPKVFVGFSDVTTLHLAFARHGRYPTIHGPMVVNLGGELSATARDSFWRTVEHPSPPGVLPVCRDQLCTVASGVVRGPLAGGCISLLAAAVGTPEEPDFRGRIVLLEDVGEDPYRIDRMLLQMHRAGLLACAAGFVIGTVSPAPGSDPTADDVSAPHGIGDVWRERIGSLGRPAIAGLPFGHVRDPLTLPLGCWAELDAGARTLTVLEPAVA
ncbi:MAG TPA: LD-carboxypeptidase [Chthonomonadales bacterium]|nr:LD-carboxypeptidase [Chthonomonadales bacterium]